MMSYRACLSDLRGKHGNAPNTAIFYKKEKYLDFACQQKRTLKMVKAHAFQEKLAFGFWLVFFVATKDQYATDEAFA